MMLKRNSQYIFQLKWFYPISLFGLLLTVTSCDNYLDETPDNRVALDELEKASQLLTNAYSISSPAFTDWLTDDVGFILGTRKELYHNQLYAWEDVTAEPTRSDTPIYFWFQTYGAIAHANEVLVALEKFPVNNDDDRARKRAVESEALLTRAYGHFMLVNMFGKHYDSETASSDLGVPYVEEPETVFIQEYRRNSVQEVYDRVERDMLRGIELVDDSFFANSGKYHFNRNAALAFASRFYLYKGEFDRCLEFSDALLGGNPSQFVRDFTSDEFLNAASSTQGYPQLYSSPDLPSNLLLMRKISLVQRLDFAFGPLDTFYGGFFNGTNPFQGTIDRRENPAFQKGQNGLFPVRYESLFQRNSLNSNVGTPYHIAITFRGEEVLLNRMEANLFLGRFSEVLADYQVLAERRYSGVPVQVSIEVLRNGLGIGDNPQFSDGLVLLNILLFERRKEFMTQGLRWFDIKRFGIEVEHAFPDGNTLLLGAEDPRKVLQIPQTAIDVGGLRSNPR